MSFDPGLMALAQLLLSAAGGYFAMKATVSSLLERVKRIEEWSDSHERNDRQMHAHLETQIGRVETRNAVIWDRMNRGRMAAPLNGDDKA